MLLAYKGRVGAVYSSRQMTFRLNVKKLFLTYPQNASDRADIMRAVNVFFGDNLDWVVIARELHQDGTPHLHVGIGLRNRCNLRGADCLDGLAGSHGNYVAMKNQKECLKYITKDDKEYLAQGIDVKACIAGKVSKFDDIARMMLEGAKVNDLLAEHPGFVLQNKRKLEDFESLASMMGLQRALLPWVGLSTTSQCVVPGVIEVVDWLNSAIGIKRLPRSPQLFLTGPPGIGKSRMIADLSKYLRIYMVPRDEEFLDHYQDGMYDLAVLDEFNHSKKIQWLNTWLDGHMLPLRKKGSQYLKTQAIPTIMISNWSLSANYQRTMTENPVAFRALSDRLLQIVIEDPFVLDFTPRTAPNSPREVIE